MGLTYKQKQAMNLLAAAYSALSEAWDDQGDDEWGNGLAGMGLLPQRDLTEASYEIFDLLKEEN